MIYNITIVCLVIFFCAQKSLATDGGSYKTVQTANLAALKAERQGDFKKADSLFIKSLAEAEKSGSTSRIMESLARIVHVKIVENKMKEAEPYFQRALNMARHVKGKDRYESDIPVWLDTMADSYYTAGQFNYDPKFKETCLEHYIDSKILCTDKYDPLLITKINLLSASYAMQGRYAESERVAKNTRIIEDRWPDRPRMIGFNGGASGGLLVKKNYVSAEKSGREAFNTDCKLDPTHRDFHLGTLERGLGTIEFEKGNWSAAEEHYATARKLNEKYKKPHFDFGLDTCFLGLVEEHEGNIKAAKSIFKKV